MVHATRVVSKCSRIKLFGALVAVFLFGGKFSWAVMFWSLCDSTSCEAYVTFIVNAGYRYSYKTKRSEKTTPVPCENVVPFFLSLKSAFFVQAWSESGTPVMNNLTLSLPGSCIPPDLLCSLQ